MRVHTGDTVGRVLAISGVWEPGVTTAFMRSLAPGDVCVDIGAHIGYFTLLAARLVGPHGRVYAFEPSPSNYAQLAANLRRNDVANVTPFQVAVGPRPGRATLFEGPGTNSGGATLRRDLAERRPNPPPEAEVDVRPLAEAIPVDDLARIRVVKIDVEGSELEVLRAVTPVFEAGQPLSVFVELTPNWLLEGAADFFDELRRAHGFRLYRLRGGYSLEALFPTAVEQPLPIDSLPAEQCDLLLRR
jgi:FkbM family methyltransferase